MQCSEVAFPKTFFANKDDDKTFGTLDMHAEIPREETVITDRES